MIIALVIIVRINSYLVLKSTHIFFSWLLGLQVPTLKLLLFALTLFYGTGQPLYLFKFLQQTFETCFGLLLILQQLLEL